MMSFRMTTNTVGGGGAAASAAATGTSFTKRLLQHMCIRWLDSFVIFLLSFHNFKAKLFVKFDGTLVVHLDVQEDAVKMAIGLDQLQYMVDHQRTDAESVKIVMIEAGRSERSLERALWKQRGVSK